MLDGMVCFIGGEDVRMRIPILSALKSTGLSVAVIGTEDSMLFDKAEIPYYCYDLHRGISPFQDRRSIKQLISIFNDIEPDLVHAFDTKPALLVPIAARKASVPSVVRTITGMGYLFSSSSLLAMALRPVYKVLQKRASRLSDITIFQNEDDKNYFESNNLVDRRESTLVRGSGVDLNLLYSTLPVEDERSKLIDSLSIGGKTVFIMVARLVKHKGVIELLEAAREVRKTVPDTCFLLVGPLASEGKQAVSQKLISSYADVVDWLDVRSDVPALLSISDVFVLPSYYREGVPRVLLEAGGLGLPLITTDMPGCRDVVRDGVEGILVPIRDSSALADAMVRLALSRENREQMGAKAKQRVEETFTLDRVASAYADIYKQLLKSKFTGEG
jgi:glycosyltransferase involved in cell wall biosynthesis